MNKTSGFVLSELNLTNFATFTSETISFHPHFNAIVGETGSGKSLILEAIQYLLGQRADRKSVRKNAEFAIIEGTFDVNDNKIKSFFDGLGYPFDDQVFIKRIIYPNGKSKSFLNHQSCNLNLLLTIAKEFIDLVGQFENQKLLSPNYQLLLLDSFIDIDKSMDQYKKTFKEYKDVLREFEELGRSIEQRAERIDFLDFQIREFKSINPTVEEYNELKIKKEAFKSKERYQIIDTEVSDLLRGDNGLFDQLKALVKISESNADLLSISNESLFEAINLVENFEQEISSKLNIDTDEEDIDQIVERLDQFQKLKRKYNIELSEIVEKFKNYEQEREQLKRIEDDISSKKKILGDLENKCFKIAKELHELRVKGAKDLSLKLTKYIRNLNMTGAEVDIRVSMKESIDIDGISHVDIFVETNPGEGYHPLRETASGGELSRILLSLRQVLSTQDSISVFLFDEIDTGIGGKTALKIGDALKSVSQNSQVISITHLPQIAVKADLLISVDKKTVTEDNEPRTYSYIKEIKGNKIKAEATKMAPI